MDESTTITISLGLLGTIASGAGVWAVMVHRVKQLEERVAELAGHDKSTAERAELCEREARSEREDIRIRLTRLESRLEPYPMAQTPVQGIPWDGSKPD